MADEQTRNITIDNVEYNVDDLSQAAKQAAANINATDGELRRLQVQVAIAQAARATFANNLRKELPESHPSPADADAG